MKERFQHLFQCLFPSKVPSVLKTSFPDRESMIEFAKKNMDVSNWLMSARPIFQERVKMEKECKEIAKQMRDQAKEAGQSNAEELEIKIQNAIDQHKEENYDIFDSDTDDDDSANKDDEPEVSIDNKYKVPNIVKRYNLPRLYRSHEKPKAKEKLYTNSPLYHPTYDQSNLIIKSKGNAILGDLTVFLEELVMVGKVQVKKTEDGEGGEGGDMNDGNKGDDNNNLDDSITSVDGLNSPMSGHGSDTRNPLSPLSPTTM